MNAHTLTQDHHAPTVDDLTLRLKRETERRDNPEPILSARTPLNLARIERLNDLWLGA